MLYKFINLLIMKFGKNNTQIIERILYETLLNRAGVWLIFKHGLFRTLSFLFLNQYENNKESSREISRAETILFYSASQDSVAFHRYENLTFFVLHLTLLAYFILYLWGLFFQIPWSDVTVGSVCSLRDPCSWAGPRKKVEWTVEQGAHD
jgi:hypothetical protein